MRKLVSFISMLLLASYDSGHTEKGDETATAKQHMKTVAFKVPEPAIALLWQRSFPEEHRKLVRRARENDPFGDASGIPEAHLTPSAFGLVGWQRGLIPAVFDQLGHPLKDGAMASLDVDGILEVTHTLPAHSALEKRFPEFVQIKDY